MPSLIYTSQKSKPKRKSKSKKLAKARSQHEDFLRRYGVTSSTKVKLKGVAKSIPNLREGLGRGTPTSDLIPGGATQQKDIFNDHKWKQGKGESQATIDEIARKAAAVGAGYHKGGLQYTLDKPEDRKKQ